MILQFLAARGGVTEPAYPFLVGGLAAGWGLCRGGSHFRWRGGVGRRFLRCWLLCDLLASWFLFLGRLLLFFRYGRLGRHWLGLRGVGCSLFLGHGGVQIRLAGSHNRKIPDPPTGPFFANQAAAGNAFRVNSHTSIRGACRTQPSTVIPMLRAVPATTREAWATSRAFKAGTF